MKKITSLTTILLLAGCAGNYRSESIGDKMARYQDRSERVNPVPNYFVEKYQHRGSRTPASAQKKSSENNKNIYFLSLLEQYESFKEIYAQHGRELKHCPVFHQSFLKYQEGSKKYSWQKKAFNTESPVLKSITSDGESFQEAIKEHMDRNYTELVKLCDVGQSDNYYIYENLVTLTRKSNVLKKNETGVNALLKTTIFYNETLLHTIGQKTRNRTGGRTIASKQEKFHFADEALNRVRATWAKNFYSNK